MRWDGESQGVAGQKITSDSKLELKRESRIGLGIRNERKKKKK